MISLRKPSPYERICLAGDEHGFTISAPADRLDFCAD